MDRICAGKSLRLRDIRVQIPYAAEQGNKSDEQGDKIDDQGIKSTEHGTARQTDPGSGHRQRLAFGAELAPGARTNNRRRRPTSACPHARHQARRRGSSGRARRALRLPPGRGQGRTAPAQTGLAPAPSPLRASESCRPYHRCPGRPKRSPADSQENERHPRASNRCRRARRG